MVAGSGKNLQRHAEGPVAQIVADKFAVGVRELPVLKRKGGIGGILLSYGKTGVVAPESVTELVCAVPIGIGQAVVAGKAVRNPARA